jgi:hypothetical protein
MGHRSGAMGLRVVHRGWVLAYRRGWSSTLGTHEFRSQLLLCHPVAIARDDSDEMTAGDNRG